MKITNYTYWCNKCINGTSKNKPKCFYIYYFYGSTIVGISIPPAECSSGKLSGLQRLWQQLRRTESESGDKPDDKQKLHGTIQAVHISKRSDGQLMGCAYVRFECDQQMAQSMLRDSGNKLVGRTVVVDWQMPKKRISPWRCW